jgi:peroxiredoxin
MLRSNTFNLTISWRNAAPMVMALLIAAAPVTAAENNTIPAEQFNLADYSGKLVYLDFWASWCTPCKASFPWMKTLQSKYEAQGLQVIAVSVDTDDADTRKFLTKYSPNFPVVADKKGELAKRYQLLAMPTSYLIDPNGKILLSHKGFRESDKNSLEQKIESVLRTATPLVNTPISTSPQVAQP